MLEEGFALGACLAICICAGLESGGLKLALPFFYAARFASPFTTLGLLVLLLLLLPMLGQISVATSCNCSTKGCCSKCAPWHEEMQKLQWAHTPYAVMTHPH